MAWVSASMLLGGAGTARAELASTARQELLPIFASMIDLLNDAQRWRDRAEEARVIAAGMRHEIARAQMLLIALGYDRLAKIAEEHTKSSNQPTK
jgi:hypothetical protein